MLRATSAARRPLFCRVRARARRPRSEPAAARPRPVLARRDGSARRDPRLNVDRKMVSFFFHGIFFTRRPTAKKTKIPTTK